jgi:hypothetical protein
LIFVKLSTRADLDVRLPISAARPDHTLVAGVHSTHVSLRLGEIDDHSIFHIDGGMFAMSGGKVAGIGPGPLVDTFCSQFGG